MKNYYIICSTADGIYFYKMTKEELENDLNSEPGDGYTNEEKDIILSKIYPSTDIHGIDLNEVTGRIIIKGEIIIPKTIKVVTKWEV